MIWTACRSHGIRRLVALIAVASLTAACGTRSDSGNDRAAGPTAGLSPPSGSAGAAGAETTTDVPVGGDVTATSPGAGGGSATGVPAGAPPVASRPGQASGAAGNRAGAAASPTPVAGSQSGGGSQAQDGSDTRGGTAPTPESNTPAPAPGAGLPPAPAPGAPPPPGSSPVSVASVGTLSGPAAATLKPVTDGAQVWVKSVNARGGLNGHPVKLVVFDDSGDPARHRAQVQEAIERHKVVAFLANAEPLTGQPSVEYVNSKGVPIIGTSGGTGWSYASPMYFPQASDGDPFLLMGLAAVADQVKDKKKLATVTCAEASACKDADRLFAENAEKLGFDLVYRAQASIAQPDYTAECLAASNAGAEIAMIVLDGNSVGRFAAACARQGYKPQFSTIVTIVLDRFKDDPNLAGIVGSSHVFPYFQTGTPATDEFAAAFKAYGGGLGNGVGIAAGWTAGKLLERAAANLPEPPTSQAILAGLWSIRNDDLGGLTYPLTFTEGKPATPRGCWFNTALQNGKWVSRDGFKLHCLDQR